MVSSTLSLKALASILSVISLTNAHMIMKTPIPYGRGSINNSPLAADGSDYPCKNIFTLTDPVNDVNHLVPGASNTLSFTGSAVHGGGSCQVALTKDLVPNVNSKWMVIKSIEGGCPANVEGNLPADPNGSGAASFQYTVPVGFEEGQYTIAWTWFNRIGNREMYMNCGRAVVGNKKKRYAPAAPKIEHRAASYPDIFKANLGIFKCGVTEGTNVAFPNPGGDLQKNGNVTPPTNCAAGAAPVAGSGSGSGASSAVASAATTTARGGAAATTTAVKGGSAGGFASGGSGKATTPAAGAGAQSTGRPGVFVSASASASQSGDAAQTTQAASATVAPIPVQPTPSSGSNGTGSGPSIGSNVQGTACSQDGAWACAADGKSFQRCASGIWSASMQVAAGTTCSPGVSMNLNMKVISLSGNAKRDLRAHEHRSPHRRSLHLLS